jgi:hypothetical protein
MRRVPSTAVISIWRGPRIGDRRVTLVDQEHFHAAQRLGLRGRLGRHGAQALRRGGRGGEQRGRDQQAAHGHGRVE